MKTFFQLSEELKSCCPECRDDSMYGSVEEDFVFTGNEQYEDWDESLDEDAEGSEGQTDYYKEGKKYTLHRIGDKHHLVHNGKTLTVYNADTRSVHNHLTDRGFKLNQSQSHFKKGTDWFKEETEHGDKKVHLNKPFRTSDGKGKFAVYTKNDKGNVVKINFGDTTGLTIKTGNPERRHSYRARHHCETPGPKWKANYWSCRSWSKGSVSAGLGV